MDGFTFEEAVAGVLAAGKPALPVVAGVKLALKSVLFPIKPSEDV